MRISLLEPDAAGRISGGYLYNQKLADAHASITRTLVATPDLASALDHESLGPSCLLLADSLFLSHAALETLFELRERTACRLGCLVHALPSFIARAHLPVQSIGSADWQPNDEELHLLARLDVVVAPGPYIPGLLAAAGVSAPCVVCLPGCEQRAETARSAAAPPIRVLSVATLAPNKGYLDAAAALSTLQDLDWRWRIVGGLDTAPAFSARLRQALNAFGLTARVEFCGALPSQAIWAEVNAADVLLHASYTENQPLIVMEALASALPVVGYHVGGMRSLVGETRAGRLAPLLDTGALAAALRSICEDPAAYAQASQAALEVTQSWTTWGERAATLCAELDRLFAAD